MKKLYSLEQFGVSRQAGTLKNGLRTILLYKPYSPIRIHLAMRSGSVFDPIGKEGLAHFTEHILMNGSQEISQRSFWKLAQEIGAYSNAMTSKMHVTVQFEIAIKEHLQQARDFFACSIENFYCTEKILEKEKEVVLAEIARAKNDPTYLSRLHFEKNISQNSAWGRPVLGYEDSVSNFSINDVEQCFVSMANLENMALIVAGDCNWENLEKTFGTLMIAHGKVQKIPSEPDFLDYGSTVAYEHDMHQVRIFYGFRSPTCYTRQEYLLKFALHHAHNGLSSLFAQEVREKRGLAYDVNDIGYEFYTRGYIGTATGVRELNVERALDSIRNTYRILIDQSFTQKEINTMQEAQWYCSVREHEKSIDWVRSEGLYVLYPDPPLPFGPYPDIYNFRSTFKENEVRDALKEYIHIEKPYIFLVGKDVSKYL